MDDTAKIPEPCPRCQRHDEILNAYAEQVVALELALEDAAADVATYRELLIIALKQLADLTAAERRHAERIGTLLQEIRRLRQPPAEERAAA